MLHAISPSLKKCKRDTCAVNDRAYTPPKRNHSTSSLTLPPYPHMKAKVIYLFASVNLRRQCTPIKRGVSHKSPALATSTSWSLTVLTATLCGRRPSRTTLAANLSWPEHKLWRKCKRRALSQNTKTWTTKHQQHIRRPSSDSDMTYKLVPPDDHCQNIAKKAIQTFKNPFIGVFSGCAPIFPMHLWCQLLLQVE